MDKIEVGEYLFILSILFIDLAVYLKEKHDVYVISAIQEIDTIKIQSKTNKLVCKA